MTSGYNTFKDDDNKPVSGDERYMHEALKEAQFAFEEEASAKKPYFCSC